MVEKIVFGSLIALAVLSIGASVGGYVTSVKQRDAFTTVCNAKGGVPVQGPAGWVCVRTASIIPVEP